MTSRAVSQPLSPERWKALEPLLDAAMARSPGRRRQFFDEACGGDAALRAELEWMVAECERKDPSLDRSAIERFGSLLEIDPPDPSSTPTLLAGRFRIERELGRGGMATVYLAHDLKHSRDVAVKMVRPELAAILGGERFLAEIRVTATLRHPHILPLFDSGEADGCIYFVMPYVEGGTLRDRLVRDRTLPPADALRIASQIAEGLASAHAQGIVHRDIKPENILLAAGGRHAYVMDFGIALAISRAEGHRGTGSWLVLGTPAYMSPEQFAGDSELDGRTDIFGLGCVLHEMLVGSPPPRMSVTAMDHDRRSVTRPWWKFWRRGIGGPIEPVVKRALAYSPADRFQRADEFARELAAASLSLSDESSGRVGKRKLVAAATAAVTVVGAAAAVSLAFRTTLGGSVAAPGVDSDLIVVLPFRSDNSGRAVLSGNNAARLLYDALGRWKDLKLGDEMGAIETSGRGDGGPASVDAARTVARTLGAGRFVWGELTDQRGVTRISAQMYDDRRPTSPVTHVVYVTAGGDAAAKIEEIADSLVTKLVGKPAAAAGTNGTRMFAALKRYADGYAALHEWNTELAEEEFRGAVDLDARFPQAWLGLAQSMAWSGTHRPSEWLDAAARAVADSSALAPRDRLLARALLALAEWRMADACDVYRLLIARDARDFAAHYGLGDCLSMDRLVVADRTAPTGWRFRGSLRTAIQQYLRALELMPSYLEGSRGQTFARLTDRVLFDDPGMYRRGFSLAPDTIWMAAFPEIENDTLAFHPRPRAAFAAGSVPPTRREAVARNRQLLRTLTAQWVTAFPRSGDAREHYAAALESVGILDTLDDTRRGPGALGVIDSARHLGAVDTVSRIRRAATQVRVLLKLRRFDAAEALAESTLATQPTPTAREANALAPLAALTGRARLTARLFATAAVDSTNELFSDPRGGGRALPAEVVTAAASFAGYAALGAPADSLRVIRDRTERSIRRWVRASDRDGVRALVLLPSTAQGQPALGAAPMAILRDPRNRLLPAWQRLARGDTVAARQLVSHDIARLASSDAVPAPDVSLQYALLALAVGDTTTATAILDRVVSSLPELGSRLTTEVFPAAALPRVLFLRATLTRSRETDARRLWSAAKVLWLHADRELRAAADSIGVGKAGRTGAGRSQRPAANPHQ